MLSIEFVSNSLLLTILVLHIRFSSSLLLFDTPR